MNLTLGLLILTGSAGPAMSGPAGSNGPAGVAGPVGEPDGLTRVEFPPTRPGRLTIPDGDVQEPYLNPSRGDGDVYSVNLHHGGFVWSVDDFVLPGLGLDLVFTRTYRSRIDYPGPLGRNWDFRYNQRLRRLSGGDVEFQNGQGGSISSSARALATTRRPATTGCCRTSREGAG